MRAQEVARKQQVNGVCGMSALSDETMFDSRTVRRALPVLLYVPLEEVDNSLANLALRRIVVPEFVKVWITL